MPFWMWDRARQDGNPIPQSLRHYRGSLGFPPTGAAPRSLRESGGRGRIVLRRDGATVPLRMYLHDLTIRRSPCFQAATMFRPEDSLVFQCVTGGIRKPIMRFRLASGRNVELIAVHFEPAWGFIGDEPRPIIDEIVARLHPNEKPLIVESAENHKGAAFLCVAYFYSDTSARGSGTSLTYSVLLVCSLVESLNRSIRSIVSDLLAKVDWEASATDDDMW